ncbi:MAG TPA: hypothetical protein VLN46_00540 [Gillisia sp.]|nr:hypothetical protein [Gillisia sp.]
MELTKIEELLARYEEGNTTLAEEKILKDYFTNQEVPPHLFEYQTLFTYTVKSRTNTFDKEVPYIKRKKQFAFIGIAASIVIAIGLFVALNNPVEELEQHQLGTIEDPEEAYLKAKETLLLVSGALNFGQEELTYVEEFDKAKNKYIKE